MLVNGPCLQQVQACMLQAGGMFPGNAADTATRLREILLCMLRGCIGDPRGATLSIRDDLLVSILQGGDYGAFQEQRMRQHLII